jgi:hypothetical protein
MIKVERMNDEKNEQEVELEIAKTEDIAIGTYMSTELWGA